METENKQEASESLMKLDKNLNVVDSVLDKIGKIFKKRWWVILLLVFGYACYMFFNALNKDIENMTIEQNEDAAQIDTVWYDDGTYDLQTAN